MAWDPYSLGYEGAKVAFGLLAGKTAPKTIPLQPYVFISRQNMNDPKLGNSLYRYDCEPKP